MASGTILAEVPTLIVTIKSYIKNYNYYVSKVMTLLLIIKMLGCMVTDFNASALMNATENHLSFLQLYWLHFIALSSFSI